eukprot:3604847-Ditylum_brightwellii.AAC.1
MKSTLVNFRDKYYIYWGAAKGKRLTDEDIVLAIGAYEATFLADLVASYMFESTEEEFRDAIFQEIYRDDGLVVWKGKWTREQVEQWLKCFQI